MTRRFDSVVPPPVEQHRLLTHREIVSYLRQNGWYQHPQPLTVGVGWARQHRGTEIILQDSVAAYIWQRNYDEDQKEALRSLSKKPYRKLNPMYEGTNSNAG